MTVRDFKAWLDAELASKGLDDSVEIDYFDFSLTCGTLRLRYDDKTRDIAITD